MVGLKKFLLTLRLYILDHIPIEKRFDVGVISTPSEFREDVIKEVIKCQIKVLIIEKPPKFNLGRSISHKKKNIRSSQYHSSREFSQTF